jgi:hypothetical protein
MYQWSEGMVGKKKKITETAHNSLNNCDVDDNQMQLRRWMIKWGAKAVDANAAKGVEDTAYTV